MTCYEHPLCEDTPDSQDHEANMVPIWAPGGPHVGPMNFAIWDRLRMDSSIVDLGDLCPLIVRSS